jgi:IS1 family transposase
MHPHRLLVLAAFSLATLTACGPSEEEIKAEVAKIMQEHYKQKEEDGKVVAKEFESATDEQLRTLLSSCKKEIVKMARQKYKPFEPFMVDEGSADVLQAQTHLSGHRIHTEDDIAKRIKRYRDETKAVGKVVPGLLNSRFSVMVTIDSFSGPKRQSKVARCEFKPGFRVEATWT